MGNYDGNSTYKQGCSGPINVNVWKISNDT